jgi:hypothetical protein
MLLAKRRIVTLTALTLVFTAGAVSVLAHRPSTAASDERKPAAPRHATAPGQSPRPAGPLEFLRSAFANVPGGLPREARQAAIKIYIHSRKVGLAAENFQVESDGRIRLSQCWIAYTGGPAVITGRCDEVHLTYDRPVATFGAMTTAGLTAIETSGGLRLSFPAPATEKAPGG